MSAITLAANAVVIRESMGSLTYLQIPLTTVSTSDTYAIGANLPIVNVDVQGDSVSAGTSTSGDATYSSSTGNITIVSANQGAITLVVFMRS